MKFNTNDLGYKLTSGQLRNKRKHSEQLNKYVAGLFDADGSISFEFTSYNKVHLSSQIAQSFSTDMDGVLLRSLRDFYNIGNITYIILQEDSVSSMCKWRLSTKDTKKLFNIIGKHLRVKGTHMRFLCETQHMLRDYVLSGEEIDSLKLSSKVSRGRSKWLKHPKHPSWAWLAGYLDGDGYYSCKLNRRRDRVYPNGRGSTSYENSLFVTVECAEYDRSVLDFIHKALRGSVKKKNTRPHYVWKRSLGKQNEKFALKFLKNMRKFSCIINKYTTICRMIKFHEDNQSQRLSKKNPTRVNDSPKST